MADAVAREARVTVGAVVAPGLIAFVQEALDLRAANVQHGAKHAGTRRWRGGPCRGDRLLAESKHGGDPAKALRPSSAKQLHDDGFGLVFQRVGCGDRLGGPGGEELTKDGVAEFARGLLQSFALSLLSGRGVDGLHGEGNTLRFAESGDEGGVFISLGATQAVVDMHGAQHKAQRLLFVVGFQQSEQKGCGVGTAGESAAEPLPGVKQGAVEVLQAHEHLRLSRVPAGVEAARAPLNGQRNRYTRLLMAVFVIFPAAGIGTRMAAATGGAPKQFFLLGGLPVLVHSLRTFLSVPRVTGVYVAVREPEQARLRDMLAEYGLADRVQVVTGGDSRQDSVANALAALPSGSDEDVVLVHDAVRPLVDAATIERTIDAIVRHGAAIVGMPAVDTIKQVERTADGALITATIPRELIVHAQTPQGARVPLMRKAFAEAANDEFVGTDESSLLERAGVAVHVVPGTGRNLKVTQPGDLAIAEFYLAG